MLCIGRQRVPGFLWLRYVMYVMMYVLISVNADASPTPLLITPLIKAGRIIEARSLSRVVIDSISMGHSGFFSVPTASGKNLNHLFAWYQPCLEECDENTPLIHYFNGGPGTTYPALYCTAYFTFPTDSQ